MKAPATARFRVVPRRSNDKEYPYKYIIEERVKLPFNLSMWRKRDWALSVRRAEEKISNIIDAENIAKPTVKFYTMTGREIGELG